MKLKNKSLLALLILTLLGFILRFTNLDQNPPALNWDEVSHGYNAFSILKTGKDEWGVAFPLIFRAFGDYKLPLYIYLTVIPVALFGLNAISVRLVSVLAGTLAIPGIYLLTRQLFPKVALNFKFKKRSVSLSLPFLAAFFLSLLPWHLFISRPALEANLGLTLFLFAVYFLLKFKDNPKHLLISSIFFSLTLHTYNTYRVLTPLFLFLYFLPKVKPSSIKRFLNKQQPRLLWLSLAVFFLSFSLVISQTLSGTGTARYQKLAILNDQTVFQIGEARQNSSLPPVLARLRHNRPLFFVEQFAHNYLNYFTPQFLYQSNGAQTQFAIPYKNLLTLNLTILAVLGFFVVIKHIKNSSHRLVLLLLALSPAAAAITASPPQALRPTPLIIPLTLLAALGFFVVVNLFSSRNWAKSAVAFILLVSFMSSSFSYLSTYWNSYRFEYSTSWQYGHQQLFEYLGKNQDQYDRIFITKYHGEPHIFYAFFMKLNPHLLQPGGDSLRFKQSDWYWTDRIGKVYFVNDWDIPYFSPAPAIPLESGDLIPTSNALLITSVEHLPSNTEIVELIEDLSGNIAFVVARFK
ncbi:ArnT family glycosyltransferase [Candidatus Chazhemtobacterium aquaticus]|uniref:Glycosyltransferase RgtA/B/C/D-like domain-containing protein n=1 Tax=Candidatus Chazhemtobacterium aquaticus TaxID=2715735 RepID=A0A857N827_9BACT|nr:glycosyltransferase family 39 protein [Candidatus Chazhemtobacterium aquaticus]QHO63483.1 hypothetical protein MICH65_0502 [Candidatus Chazhemtobacterium aquaticus]